MAQLFPNKEIPQDYFKIMFEKSFDDFCFTVIDAVNNFNVTKKEIIEAVENDGYLINGMDQLLKTMAGFHKFKLKNYREPGTKISLILIHSLTSLNKLWKSIASRKKRKNQSGSRDPESKIKQNMKCT